MKHLLIIFMLLMTSTTALADDDVTPGLWSRIQESLSQTWHSKNYELYIPVNTWHNRSYYTAEKINSYNEQPWGIGVGTYRIDNDGDWHALYLMEFQDSHNKVEPVAGYGYQKIWHPTEDLRLGAGYTAGVTIRQDYNYVPIPVIAPIASVAYKQLTLQSTYIPGGVGHGNILFTWLRWQIN